MYNTRPQAPWVPFTIPATPTITNNDVYSLTCSNGAQSSKNPSQFLQWRKVNGGGLPDGSNYGDLIQWDPSAGDGGEWVVLEVPEASEENPKFLYWNGSSWNFIETKSFDVCENGTPKEYKIPAIEIT